MVAAAAAAVMVVVVVVTDAEEDGQRKTGPCVCVCFVCVAGLTPK